MNHNLPSDSLLEIALKNGEGTIVKNGALVVTTGKRTGRSPADKFIVSDDKTRDVVNWGPVSYTHLTLPTTPRV